MSHGRHPAGRVGLTFCTGAHGPDREGHMQIIFDQPDSGTLKTRPFQELQAAFAQFHRHFCIEHREKLHSLSAGQQPGAMVLSCCDSRTDPALLFSCEPGDIFVNRSIAALVPEAASPAGACLRAATAYAVDTLKVHDLIVLGHTSCGGIKGLVEGVEGTPLSDWLDTARSVLEEARRRCPDADRQTLIRECERLAPVMSARNLLDYPWVRKAADEGRLIVHAWLFDLHTGHLLEYDFTRQEYVQLPE